jgi:opacity protein-like surface antigen
LKKTLVLLAIATLCLWTTSHALIGFGVRAGTGSLGSSGGSQSALLLGAHVDFTALPMIGLEACVTYWSKSQDFSTGKTTSTLIPLEGTALYKISLPGSPITPYVGAGLGLYMGNTKFQPQVGSDTTVTSNKFGIHGAAGANFKLPTMPLSFGVQGKYAAIFSDPSSHLFSIVGLVTYNF